MHLSMSPYVQQNFTMPAETERHAACWMAWPSRPELWGARLATVREEHALVAEAISRFEPVVLVCRLEDEAAVRERCGQFARIWAANIDDSWMRDSGPTFLRGDRGGLAIVDWGFNAWGEKYQPHDSDALLKRRIAEELGLPLVTNRLIAEGGAILSDGQGTILATESCMLHPNRNPGLTREEVETELLDALGATKVVWLPGDVAEIETNGHVDCLASIVAPGKVMLEDPATEEGARAETLAENRRALQSQTDACGRRFEIVDIVAAPRVETAIALHQTSYVNFYIANGAVFMPGHGVPADRDARHAVAAAFPDREVIQLNLRALPYGGGGIHCITQNQPAHHSFVA